MQPHTQRRHQLGISVTWPLLELMRVLQEAGKVLSAQAIAFIQQSAGQSEPQSTIYINLKRLEDAGILTRIRLDAQSLFKISQQKLVQPGHTAWPDALGVSALQTTPMP